MENIIAPAIVGLAILVMGIFNMCGYISTLKKHHRHRVTEADRKPFGRLVGLGTIHIGAGMLIFSLLTFCADKTGNLVFTTVGVGLLIAAVVAGIVLNVYAMIKYNHGIF